MTDPLTALYAPPAALAKEAYVASMKAYNALCAEAEADYEGYWARLARELVVWKTPFTKVLNSSEAPFFKWFEDGTLNVSYNCLDRQVLAGLGDKTAIIFEADDGTATPISYSALLAKTCQLANALREKGVKKGDRVVIYMPMSVEGVVAMQACARIGATHSVVFGGFSAQSLRDRIEDAGAVMLLTATVPWCISTKRRTIARPRPVPPSLVVVNGSKSRAATRSGSGGPLLAMTMRACPGALRVTTSRRRS